MEFSAKYGCRICQKLIIKVNYHTCFLEKESIKREVNNFRCPDQSNVSQKKNASFKVVI
jgi:hypothetical protein